MLWWIGSYPSEGYGSRTPGIRRAATVVKVKIMRQCVSGGTITQWYTYYNTLSKSTSTVTHKPGVVARTLNLAT